MHIESIQVLLVDDEPAITESLQYVLERNGMQCRVVATATDALKLLREATFSAVVLDVGLPDMSGFDACREIRKTSNVPILFLTAHNDEIDRILGLELGADDYILKPFSPREVVARIRSILRRVGHQQPVEPTSSERPFEIDKTRCLVRYFGTPLELSAHEFKLLCVMLRSPGRVFTREHLMNAVWEDPSMSLERTVDTHIKNLRSAFRKVKPDVEVVITHRGLGYSIKEEW